MKKNTVALAVYRTAKAANDDGSYTASAIRDLSTPHLPIEGRSGWDPFEVWRTRIHVEVARDRRAKR